MKIQAVKPCILQMLVDDIGDVTITNDGATILKLLEVEHPAAKVSARFVCTRADLQLHLQQGSSDKRASHCMLGCCRYLWS